MDPSASTAIKEPRQTVYIYRYSKFVYPAPLSRSDFYLPILQSSNSRPIIGVEYSVPPEPATQIST
ncbi:MAG: hypothetical protein ACI8Z1_003584 [Candidatus Azotimanducaceae bacterium]|jgi:hypothetical protein